MTEFLAIWGAVLSTVAVGWNLFLGLKDRGQLEISGIVGKNANRPDEPYRFLLVITNVGRRPVQLDKIALSSKKDWKPLSRFLPAEKPFWKRWWIGLTLLLRPWERRYRATDSFLLFDRLPDTLGEGERHHEIFEGFSFINENLMTIFVTDSCERKYEMPRKRLNTIVEQAKNLREEESAL